MVYAPGNHVQCVDLLLRRVDCNDGIASHCETLMHRLRESSVKIILITGPVNFDAKTKARYNALASLAEKWVVLELAASCSSSLKAARRIAQVVRDHKVELLHLHGLGLLPLVRLARASLRAANRGDGPLTVNRSAKLRLGLGRALLQMFWPIAAPNGFAGSGDCDQLGIPQDWFISDIRMSQSRVELIFNGVDNIYFRPPTDSERRNARGLLGVKGSDFVCSLVGRYELVKGHDVLCDAVAQLQPAIAGGMRVFLVGAGDDGLVRKVIQDRHVAEIVKMQGYVEDMRTSYIGPPT